MTQVLTKEWYTELQEQSAENFINLPIEFQMRGYDYKHICKAYLTFFRSDDNTRQDKLKLAQKFLKFIRNINKNRAKEELGEEFFMAFDYFMNNFSDLISKNDLIHLEALSVLTDAIDKSQFVEDIINVDELHSRIKKLKIVEEKEEIINADWSTLVETQYRLLNNTHRS